MAAIHARLFSIAQAFLQRKGLPFSNVLSPESIQKAFLDENGMFGQQDLFSTQIVLWAFLAQTLRDGKGAACSQAVADIAAIISAEKCRVVPRSVQLS